MDNGVLPVKTTGKMNKLVLYATNLALLLLVSADVSVRSHVVIGYVLGAIAGNQRFQLTSSDQMPIYNRIYSCMGSEVHLRDCPSFEPNRTEPCGYRRNAYVVCQGTHS